MYINRKLLYLMRGHTAAILDIVLWYTVSLLCDAGRLISWAMFFIGAIHGWKGLHLAAAISGIIGMTMLRRCAEHALARHDARKGTAFKKALRKTLFGKLFHLGPQFTDTKRSGELVNTLRQETEWLKYYYINYLPLSISILITGIGFAIYGYLLSPAIGIASILAIVGVLASPPAFFGLTQKWSAKEWAEHNQFYSDCMDGLRGITTLKAFNIHKSQRERIDRQSERLRNATMKNLIVTTLNTQVIEFFASLVIYLPALIGVMQTGYGTLAWEEVLLLFVLSHAIAEHCRRILGMWLRAAKGITGLPGVYEILHAECPYSLSSASDGTQPIEMGDIQFQNTSFSYSGDGKEVLRNIHLVLKQGTQTALVGASGSGKSTLAQLLFGFYQPQQGRICVGDAEIDKSTVYAVQEKITAIWQDCHIFHTSCYENILLAKPDATEDEVYEAAKRANIHEMILSLPEGYKTVIGSGGMNFSGGEKQRIAIARAFLRDAPILILDEATSSLDRKNEAEIQSCIRNLSKGKTVLVIAHRLDTIRHADQICVMEAGMIIEQGTHDELMAHKGRYFDLMGASVEEGGDNSENQI